MYPHQILLFTPMLISGMSRGCQKKSDHAFLLYPDFSDYSGVADFEWQFGDYWLHKSPDIKTINCVLHETTYQNM